MDNNVKQPTAQSITTAINNVKPTTKKVSLSCNIRLRPGLVAIPNQPEEEFTYFLSSILSSNGGPLKGVTGVLERLIMPSIIDVSTNDNTFNTHIKEYWANFSNVLPPDNSNKKDTEKGIVMKIQVTLLNSNVIALFEKLTRIDEKYAFVHGLLEEQERDSNNTKTIVLDAEYYADFIKLGFALKHSRIANRVEDREKSPKIFGYIYEKAIAVEAQQSEMEVYTTFATNIQELQDEKKVNALLIHLGESVVDSDTITDKKIIIYNLAKASHEVRVKVNKLLKDTNWEYKYYINQGLILHILKQPENSKLIQYGESIIGNDLETAAEHLKSTAEGNTLLNIIKDALKTK